MSGIPFGTPLPEDTTLLGQIACKVDEENVETYVFWTKEFENLEDTDPESCLLILLRARENIEDIMKSLAARIALKQIDKRKRHRDN